MFLKRLYSEPSGLFRSGKPEHPYTIVFKDGFNFIFGKKDNASESKDSLNGLGKSTVCDLIDFCLLADFNAKNSRFFKEKQRLESYTIVLEFEVNDKTYLIKRSTEKHLLVTLGIIGEEVELEIKDAKSKLLNFIFDNPSYSGKLKELSYRTLMTFFMKIHKKKNAKGEFSDPINFLTNNNALYELLPYHFFLLGFDNTMLYENSNIQKILNEIQKAISQVKNLFKNNYNIPVNEVDSKLSRLRNEAKKIEAAVNAFKLAEQHKDVESKLNEFTGRIKFLSEQNFWLDKKVKSYKESYELKDTISDAKIRSIEKLYSELNNMFKQKISKSLKEAVDFRKKIAQSREEFLKEEIQELQTIIRSQEKEIQELDNERQKLFVFLKSKEAFKDLTEAFYFLGEKEKEISDLEGKVKVYNDLQNQKTESDAKDVELKKQAVELIETLKNDIDAFEALFSDVYRAIYPESEESGFSIRADYEGKNKVDISISFDKDESKGWNKGRTLVYDIAVMLNTIQKNINAPKFLIHDGIFDGMDKAHFVALYHYIQSLQKQGKRFQYIVTMIEEGQLSESFGKTDDLTPEKIAEQAIVVLSKQNPLWR
jgi:uncharacterized protein YydD (DUF2326 family)